MRRLCRSPEKARPARGRTVADGAERLKKGGGLMPAVLSHCLLADRVMADLREYEPQLIADKDAFYWGASGPDIFFTHRVMPLQKGQSCLKYGKKMHSAGANEIINFLADYAVSHADPVTKGYLLGFITHYAFDSILHPYVLYAAEQLHQRSPEKTVSVCHNEIEACLDTLLLRYDKKMKISSYKLSAAAPLKADVNKTIAQMLSAYLLAAYGENIPTEVLVQVQKDWHRSLVYLNDHLGLKKRAARLGEKIIGLDPLLSPIMRVPYPDLSFDYANMKHGEWYSEIDGETHTDNFFEMTAAAEELSLKLILMVLAGHRLTPEDCSASFSGHK